MSSFRFIHMHNAALRSRGRERTSATQVLFFTHHRHLVDIARESLGDAVNVISLTDEALASAA